jgi:hypothetical protein
MRDLQTLAAQILRIGLWSGTALVAAGGLLQLAGPGTTAGAGLLSAMGIGVIIGTPFVTLFAMGLRARRHVLGWYAAVTLVLALVGLLLAA